MADDLVVSPAWRIPPGELAERFSRSSGPGGQGVNTADSRVELSFDVAGAASVPAALRARLLDRLASRLVDGVLTVAASEHRTQLDNRRAARERLGDLLRRAAASPPPPAPGHPAHPRLEGAPPGGQAPPLRRQARTPGPLRLIEAEVPARPTDRGSSASPTQEAEGFPGRSP